MYDSEVALNLTGQAITKVEQKAKSVGQTSATTARQFEKFREVIGQSRQKLEEAARAFEKGEIGAKDFAKVVVQTESKINSLNSRIRDSSARLTDFGTRASRAGSMFRSVFSGTIAAAGTLSLASAIKDLGIESVHTFATLDKLTRFTATLDKNFQTPEALLKFREDIKKLSTEIPHSAESIAKASFTIKSAFQNLSEEDLIAYLREFGNAATASNTDIASHAQNMAALAKQYNITGKDLQSFSALIASSFGQALASDSQVAAGFNRILNAAKSTKQPLADMVAAMSTLQSASSDAESNTTLLLNTYAKLTDPKYIEGIKEMGVSVFDAAGNFKPLNQLINEMAEKLRGLNDQQINDKLAWAKDLQAREGIKTLIRLVDDYNKQLSNGADQEAFKKKNDLMANSVEARWEKMLNRWNNIKLGLGEGIFQTVDDAGKLNLKNLNTSEWKEVIAKGLRNAITGGFADVSPVVVRDGTSLGENLADGMAVGIASGQSGVVNAAIEMARRAYNAAKDFLWIGSPSKLFAALGKDTAQGYIDGIAAMKASVQAAMASILDISGLKTGKGDKEGVELLTQLINEIARANTKTKEQEVLIELTAGKYSKLNAAIKEKILLAARENDAINANIQLQEMLQNLLDKGLNKSEYQLTAEKLKTAEFTKGNEALKKRILYMTALNELPSVGVGTGDFSYEPMGTLEGTGTGGEEEMEQMRKRIQAMQNDLEPPPPLINRWANFWEMMQRSLKEFRDSMPSFKEAVGVNLIGSIETFGSSLGQAIAQWDGTLKGFLHGLVQTVRQVVQQIVSELIRILIIKAITSIASAFVGSLGGISGGSAGGLDSAGDIGGGHFASGGAVPGFGSGDTVAAMLTPGEYVVKKDTVNRWGKGFFDRLNYAPRMAFAGGGMVGGSSSTTSNSWAPVFHINIMGGGGNAQQTARSVKQGIHEALATMEHERRRNK